MNMSSCVVFHVTVGSNFSYLFVNGNSYLFVNWPDPEGVGLRFVGNGNSYSQSYPSRRDGGYKYQSKRIHI